MGDILSYFSVAAAISILLIYKLKVESQWHGLHTELLLRRLLDEIGVSILTGGSPSVTQFKPSCLLLCQ